MKRGSRDRQEQRVAARQRVAVEAARLIAAHGMHDVQQARRKAARRSDALESAFMASALSGARPAL